MSMTPHNLAVQIQLVNDNSARKTGFNGKIHQTRGTTIPLTARVNLGMGGEGITC